MAKLYYDERNRGNIALLADHTKAAALKWYEYCVKNSLDILIYETIRTEAKQREYVASGASQTMRSFHLKGQALDWVPVDEKGKLQYGWYEKEKFKKAIAYAKSLGFIWGGDWKDFVDKPHLQYNYKGYGTDTFSEITVIAPKTQVKNEVITEPSFSGNTNILAFQKWLNAAYNAGLKTDGLYGPKTKAAATKALQTECNKQFGAKLVVDGIWGPKTKAAVRTVRKGAKGNITRIIQGMLYCLGYDPKGFDGIFGNGCDAAVRAFQVDHNLSVDGLSGQNTFYKMFV
ncbi:peptidoglycan-binding protein [Metabacillus sp. HB246100]